MMQPTREYYYDIASLLRVSIGDPEQLHQTSPLSHCDKLLLQQIPSELHADLHILLLNLGRRYCRPHNPNYNSCPLNKQCPKAF
jgi:endonuclease III